MGKERLRALRDRIDQGLMALDQALCERARKEGATRDEIAVVDCTLDGLRAMLDAFSQDRHLWSQFLREVRGPRDVVFDQVYAKALALGRARSGPRPDPASITKALTFCDREGWARRIQVLAGGELLDGLTIHAVAYVLGGNSAARRDFIGLVEGRVPATA